MSIFQVYIILIVINLGYGIFVSIKNTSYNVTIRGFKIFNLDNLLGIVLLIDLVYIAITSKNIADLETYEMLYNTGSTALEQGYTLLAYLGRSLGFDYVTFRGFLFVTGFLLIWIGLRRLRINVNLVLGLYAIYPFTMDVIQNRNLLATSIIIFSIPWLCSEKKGNTIKYIIGVLLATLIHRIAIVYLVLLLAKKGRNEVLRKRFLSTLVVLSFLLALVMRIAPGTTQVVINFLMSINRERTTAYTQVLLRWGFLLFWTMELLYVLSSKILIDGIKNESFSTNNNDWPAFSNAEIIDLIYWVNLCCCCFLPLLMININFYRIYRDISLINYMQLPILLGLQDKQRKWIGIVIFLVAFVLNVSQNIGLAPEDVYYPIFGIIK